MTTLGRPIAVPVVLATVELRKSDARAEQSRQDLINERRIDFQVNQLIALALSLGDFGKSSSWEFRWRVKLLPAQLIPTAVDWTGTHADREDSDLWASLMATRSHDEDWGTWIRIRIQVEIESAISELTSPPSSSPN